MSYKLPEEQGFKEMLDMIVGDDANLSASEPSNDDDLSFFARYVDPEGALVAACVADFPSAVALGASLSMIGGGGIDEMLSEKKLSEVANENFYEVMNMFSSLFMDDATAHLKLTSVEDAKSALEENGLSECERKDYAVTAGRYGSGKVGFVIF